MFVNKILCANMHTWTLEAGGGQKRSRVLRRNQERLSDVNQCLVVAGPLHVRKAD